MFDPVSAVFQIKSLGYRIKVVHMIVFVNPSKVNVQVFYKHIFKMGGQSGAVYCTEP